MAPVIEIVLTHADVQKVIAKDRAAVSTFMGALTPVIQTRATKVLLRRSVTRSRDIRQEVLDLTQEVFVNLFADDCRLLRNWDPKRAALKTYVGLIAGQTVAAILRSVRNNPFLDEPVDPSMLENADETSDPEQIAATKEVLTAVLDALRDRPSDRGLELFQWLFVEGKSVQEVCVAAAMTADAVYAWRSRIGRLARKLVCEYLSDAMSGHSEQSP